MQLQLIHRWAAAHSCPNACRCECICGYVRALLGLRVWLRCAPPACLLLHRLSRGCCPQRFARPGSVCTNHLSGACCMQSGAAGLSAAWRAIRVCVCVWIDQSAVARLLPNRLSSLSHCRLSAYLSAGLHRHRLPRSGFCLVLFAVWALPAKAVYSAVRCVGGGTQPRDRRTSVRRQDMVSIAIWYTLFPCFVRLGWRLDDGGGVVLTRH